MTVLRWLESLLFGSKVLEVRVVLSDDGGEMSELAKGEALKKLTMLQPGWRLLKGTICDAMQAFNQLQATATSKRVDFYSGAAHGMAMALRILKNQESLDLVKAGKYDRDRRADRKLEETER